MRFGASNAAAGRQQWLGLMVAPNDGGGCYEFAGMVARRMWPSIVATGRGPASGEIGISSSQSNDRGHDVSILMATVGVDGW